MEVRYSCWDDGEFRPLTLSLSCVASSQSHLSGRTTFFVTRALLGLLEGYVSSRTLVTVGP